jgi:hypothetical protein
MIEVITEQISIEVIALSDTELQSESYAIEVLETIEAIELLAENIIIENSQEVYALEIVEETVTVEIGQDAVGIAAAETFETVSKNLKGFPFSLSYEGGLLERVDYTTPFGVITKTFGYTTGLLTSVELSGAVPGYIPLTKTLIFENGFLVDVSYS